MTAAPLDRIQAAIEKLTKLRDANPPGDWEVKHHPGWPEVGVTYIYSDGYEVATFYTDNSAERAEFVRTLHRTIDAQLALLREALEYFDDSRLFGVPDDEASEFYVTEVALAEAILGGEQ